MEVAGTDATEAYEEVGHSEDADEKLEKLYIGELIAAPALVSRSHLEPECGGEQEKRTAAPFQPEAHSTDCSLGNTGAKHPRRKEILFKSLPQYFNGGVGWLRGGVSKTDPRITTRYRVFTKMHHFVLYVGILGFSYSSPILSHSSAFLMKI